MYILGGWQWKDNIKTDLRRRWRRKRSCEDINGLKQIR
jgi:hypothetical protein